MRILVTDAHELAGLGAIRSLGRAGHQVTAGFPRGSARPPGAYSRYCAASCAYPDPWHSQRDFSDWLVTQAARWDLVLPIAEAAVLAAVSCRSRFPDGTVIAAPSDTELTFTLSKRRATERAIAAGVPCPQTAFSRAEAARLPPPYIVRTDNRLAADGGYHKGRTWFVDDAVELGALLEELEERGDAWLAQQHIVGKGVGAFLLTWRGEVLMQFAHERLHEVPFYGGVSSLRRSTHDPQGLSAARTLLESLSYSGVAMVEFRRCASSGVAYFVEINGRLWGSLALALHAGADFPARLIECYQSPAARPPERPYRIGIYCRNVYPGEVDYLRSVLKAAGPVRGSAPPPRGAAIREFFRLFFVRGMHYDYLWWRDPLPALRHGASSAARILASRWRRRAGRRREAQLVREFMRRPAVSAPDLRRVLFLCYGNICRSPFAGVYWNQMSELPPAKSAGFVPTPGRRTPVRIARLAEILGVKLSMHRSRVVAAADIDDATAILLMDGQNLADLLAAFPAARAKAWLLGSFRGERVVRDPYTLPDAQAMESLQQIRECIDALVQRYPQGRRAPGESSYSLSEPERAL